MNIYSKLILIKRKSGSSFKSIAHIGTGNFHEKTAKIYTDFTLLTADSKILKDINKVFDFFEESAKLSETPYDDMALLILPQIKKMALEQIDKVDGEQG